MTTRLTGRIASVNVSHGGVPKRAIPGGWVDRLGLEADAHEEPPPMHGGLDQAISVYSVESIARVVADGHRAFPGAFGENLTLEGIELDAMRSGDRLHIGGGSLVLELTKRAEPCQTIAHNFVERRIARIGSKQNPQDARWYAASWLRVPFAPAIASTSTAGADAHRAARVYDARVIATVRVERTGPGDCVARVTLARPEVHNAFNATVIAELRTIFTALARESPTELRAVVLAGDGPSFCAGADIAWMRAAMALDVEGNEQDAMAMADMFEAIDTCPVPVVARVHGAALGGGMGLCAVSDVVIAESGARFGFTETRLGILPAVISPFVVAKIGESHARSLFPGGRRFDAVRAQRIGLVHDVVEGEVALDEAVDAAVADVLAAGPTAARAAKAIVREIRGVGHGSAKWHTARVIARQRTSEEAQEGFRAFAEKRPAAWVATDEGEQGRR